LLLVSKRIACWGLIWVEKLIPGLGYYFTEGQFYAMMDLVFEEGYIMAIVRHTMCVNLRIYYQTEGKTQGKLRSIEVALFLLYYL